MSSFASFIISTMTGGFTPVLLDLGQSNAEGQLPGTSPDSIYQTPNPLVKIKGYRGSGAINISTFETVDFNAGNCLGNPNGIEVYVAYYATKPIYIVKVVKGGTNLAVDWASGSTLRNKLIANINEAISQLSGKKLKWINYWNQWEYEVYTTSYCENYFVNYKGMWDEVTAATGVEPLHLIVEPKPGSGFYVSYPENTAIIIEQQTLIVNHYKGFKLPATGFGTVDSVHYNQDGHRIMAERVMPYLN